MLTKATQDQQVIIENSKKEDEKKTIEINRLNKNYEALLKRVEQLELASNQ